MIRCVYCATRYIIIWLESNIKYSRARVFRKCWRKLRKRQLTVVQHGERMCTEEVAAESTRDALSIVANASNTCPRRPSSARFQAKRFTLRGSTILLAILSGNTTNCCCHWPRFSLRIVVSYLCEDWENLAVCAGIVRLVVVIEIFIDTIRAHTLLFTYDFYSNGIQYTQ